jgi:hypothetical protein
LEKAESMHLHAECPQSWWEFSFETAVHVYNRTPLRRTNWSTPYENIWNSKPDIQYFKTFGCLAWVYKPKEIRKNKNKLDNRSEPMTFIGYEIGSKAYKFMHKDNSMFIATHAWFDEERFPRANSANGSSKNKLEICPPDIQKDKKDIDSSTNPNISDTDHYDYPHSETSSDDTPSDMQETSSSEDGRLSEEDEEEQVEDELKPPTESDSESESDSSNNEKESSIRCSREGSFHSFNEKSEEGSNHGDETNQGPKDDTDDFFEEEKESEKEQDEPEPSQLCRSSRVPKPVIRYGNVYGDKPAIQIEKEIKSDKAWQKTVEPKAKTLVKQAYNSFHDDLDKLVKEGGNKTLQYLPAQEHRSKHIDI